MKKITLVVAIMLLTILVVSLTACSGEGGTNSIYGKYYEYENGVKNPDSCIELKVGKKWTWGTDSGEFTLDGNVITIIFEGVEFMTGTVENGVLSFELLGMPAGTFYKDGAYDPSNPDNEIEKPVGADEKALIKSVVNGTVEGLTCIIEVAPNVSDIDISGSIETTKGASWQLYADALGQINIPTKRAANLVDGENTYYIVVNSADGTVNRTYTLLIWRNYDVEVTFYANGELVKTLTQPTHSYIKNDEFIVVEKEGYTFNGWKHHTAGEDYYITGIDPDYNISSKYLKFVADLTPNTYAITLDANGGNCSSSSKKVTYADGFTLPVPSRTGYTFAGWYYNGTQITDKEGKSTILYKTAGDIKATADWDVNYYTLTVSNANTAAGSISTSGGSKAYGQSVTITATPNAGYTFEGWYNGGTKVSDNASYTFTMPAKAVTYTAKLKVASEMQNFNFTSTRTTCTITGIKDKSVTSIVVPDYVTEISKDAFKGCTNLTSVTIGDSVTTIGTDAFSGCRKLVEVYNRSSLNITKGSLNNGSVGWYARNIYTPTNGWRKLSTDEDGYIIYTNGADKILISYIGEETALIIPNGITEIYEYALDHCSSLTSITIPFVGANKDGTGSTRFDHIFGKNDVPISLKEVIITGSTTIGKEAFSGCTSLTSITIPDSVTTIGSSAFKGCSGLTSITIPDSVTTIGERAFYDCDGLTSIVIPDSVTTIGEDAFAGCDRLTSVTFGENSQLTTIGGWAFWGCTSLTSIVIPDSVTTIGERAFYDCDGLTSIVIPDNVTTVGSSAFDDCGSLTNVSYKGDIAGWCSISFGDDYANPMCYADHLYIDGKLIEGELVIPDSVTTIGKYAFYYCTGLTSVTIGNSVTTIGERAFWGCTSLTSIVIPDSVTTIGEYAFNDCDSLKDVYYTGDLAGWCGILFGSDNANPICNGDNLYIDGNLVEGELVIPDSVTTIGKYAFYGCTSLTSVTIGDSVTTIGYGAFRECSSLTSVTIGNSVTTIGNSAFYNCTSLTSVTIGNSVTTIGKYAFYNCTSLTSVTFEDTTTWYITSNETNWQNKTGGTKTIVTNASTNATYLKSTYDDYYWYKK